MSRVTKSLLGSVALTTLSLNAAFAVESESFNQIVEGVVQATTGKAFDIAIDGEPTEVGRIQGFTKIGKGLADTLTPFDFGVDEVAPQQKAQKTNLSRSIDDSSSEGEPLHKKSLKAASNAVAAKPLISQDAQGVPSLDAEELETYQDGRILLETEYDLANLQSKRDEFDKKVAIYNEISAELERLQNGQLNLEQSLFFDDAAAFHTGDVNGYELEALKSYQAKVRLEMDELEKRMQYYARNPDMNLKFLQKKGCILRAFEGATGRKAKVGHGGSFKQDDRGFVYYDPTTHRMNILVHGSRNADDWDANFDGELVPLTNYGYSFEEVGHAMVHRGFANIAFATMEDLEKQIMTILSMTDNPNKILGSLVINTFGHSQSGPVAQMMAFFLATKFAKKLYGADYDNTTFNHVRSIAFSAARPGNAAFADLFNRVVGNQNAIRVNVHGDPVPLTGPSEGFAAVLKPVAQAAELWATYLPVLTPKVMQEKLFEEGVPLSERIDAMKGAKGVGTLALDPAGDALVRNLARKEVAQAALRAAGQDLVSGFAELDPREVARNASEAWNEGRRGGGNVVLATAKAAQSIAKSAVQPILGLAAGVVDLVKGIAAPIHYGSVESSANGAYDPKNVSDDPNALLKNGFVHEQAKAKAAKAAEEKAQASYWSTVKGWFGY